MKKTNLLLSIIFLALSLLLIVNILWGFLDKQPVKTFDDSRVIIVNIFWIIMGLILSVGFFKELKWIVPVYSIVLLIWIVFIYYFVFGGISFNVERLLDNFIDYFILIGLPLLLEIYLLITLFLQKNKKRL
jgi:hypothetical protein